VKRYSWR